MIRPRLPRFAIRFGSAALFALQALIWGGAPILDAQAEAASSSAVAHVEDVGSSSCPRVHAPDECQTCRTLASGAVAGTPPSLSPLSVRALSGFQRTAVELVAESPHGSLGSRAPPPRLA